MSSLSVRLRLVADQLREISAEHSDMKFTPSEQAMAWPLSIIMDEDFKVDMWCAKEDCSCDGHSSLILIDPESFTMADLLGTLADHIETWEDR